LGFDADYKPYGYTNAIYNEYPLELTNSSGSRTPKSRVPAMGVSATSHRRTLSNVSNTSNINQSFCIDNDMVVHHNDNDIQPMSAYSFNNLNITNNKLNLGLTATGNETHNLLLHNTIVAGNASTNNINRMRDYEKLPNYFGRQILDSSAYGSLNQTKNEINQYHYERPLNFEHEYGSSTYSKVRSSLKKYSHTPNNTRNNSETTPPDSLSDDSSYLSAKDGSSISSQSRVRFSPETSLANQMMHQHHSHNMNDSPPSPTTMEALQTIRRISRKYSNEPSGQGQS
jgi:hypothetical protein